MTLFNLSKITDHDHNWLIELHNDPLVLKNITNPKCISIKDHMKWWNSIKNNKNELRLIFKKDNINIGLTKFYQIDLVNRNCILGADIHKDFRGLGYAKIMWSLMIEKCFKELKLYRISLTTAEYNLIGQKVYTNLGFKEEGRLIKSLYRDNQYYDQICMYMLNNE